MSDDKQAVEKIKKGAEKAQANAQKYVETFKEGTQYPIAKFFARLLGALGIVLIVVGLLSLLKGAFADSGVFGGPSASMRFGPGLAMLFLGALGAAIASGLDILRDSADRNIKRKK